MSQGTLGLQQAGQQNPLFGGMPPQMAGLLQMGMPYLQSVFTQQTGMLPGPFFQQGNYADFQTRMEDQRQMMMAMQRSSNADTSNLYNTIRGFHHATKMGWGP